MSDPSSTEPDTDTEAARARADASHVAGTDKESRPARSASASGQLDRRTMVASAALLAVVIVGGVAVVSVVTDDGPRRDARTEREEGRPPSIVVQPNSGRAPEDPGDRGGWEQLALFALLVVTLAVIAAVVVRGGRRARAGRAAWKAAAASGHDGAVNGREGSAVR